MGTNCSPKNEGKIQEVEKYKENFEKNKENLEQSIIMFGGVPKVKNPWKVIFLNVSDSKVYFLLWE